MTDEISALSSILPPNEMRQKIQQWLSEDAPSFDFGGYVVGNADETCVILCKSEGVLAGVPFVNAVFKELHCSIEWHCKEGDWLVPPVTVATVGGNARKMLLGERLALNILARASGVATLAREACQIAKAHHWTGIVAGTRKTTPGFRVVEKYSLLVGGIAQHRFDLSSMVMLKDNHIWAASDDIAKAVQKARFVAGFSTKIEVECRSYEGACTAANAGAEVVMLDNFEHETAKAVAEMLKKDFPHLTIEISGGINFNNMHLYFCKDIDVLSMSCLTQGYKCVDFSLKIKRPGHDPTNPIVVTPTETNE